MAKSVNLAELKICPVVTAQLFQIQADNIFAAVHIAMLRI